MQFDKDDIQTKKQSIPHKIFPKLAWSVRNTSIAASAQVLANTCIDALGHLIESYFNSHAGEYSRMLCMTGFEVWVVVKCVARHGSGKRKIMKI